MRRKNDSFLDHLEYYFDTYLPTAKGLARSTIVSYKATFRLLVEFMYTVKGISADDISFNSFDEKVITDFLDWLESERNCSVTTRNQRLSAIAAFSNFAQNRDFDSAFTFRNCISKIPRKKAARKSRSSFTRDEVKVLFEIPDARKEIGLRDKTLLCFMYASGARAQEACNLTVGDIQFFNDRAGINIYGKGQKARRIGIPAGAADMLQKYIAHRNITHNADRHVFSSQTHEKMTVSCIEEIFAKYVDLARRKHPDLFRNNYTPHSMRHTTATHMLEAGVLLIVVKNFLGHVSLQTTQIYTEVSLDTLNRELKAWNDKWFIKGESDSINSKGGGSIPLFLR